eukprot:TRINITY_DN6227_c0_g1_i1.p2 TRINITY_DN6227_c0_g1~~TRINITY_DN6227_c0_g1_i1.p2  ORF type:complete len:79 (-),score=6.47 TRINITY_DN6227_c0_g1_i1:321-557(-)
MGTESLNFFNFLCNEAQSVLMCHRSGNIIKHKGLIYQLHIATRFLPNSWTPIYKNFKIQQRKLLRCLNREEKNYNDNG